MFTPPFIPSIGDIYLFRNDFFYEMDRKPFIADGYQHYFFVYKITNDICYSKILTSSCNNPYFNKPFNKDGISLVDNNTEKISAFLLCFTYYNNKEEDFCFCTSETESYYILTLPPNNLEVLSTYLYPQTTKCYATLEALKILAPLQPQPPSPPQPFSQPQPQPQPTQRSSVAAEVIRALSKK